jgi:hypothetical protein
MRSLLLLTAAVFAMTLSAADETVVPAREEPAHKVVFENDYVCIIDVQMAPGDRNKFHRHTAPSVVVYLTPSTNRSESLPAHTILTRDVLPGQSRFAAYDQQPLVHRVLNTGSGLFRVFDIEILKRPTAAPRYPALPAAAQVQWTEPLVRSSRVPLAPGANVALPAGCALLLVTTTGAVDLAPAPGHSGAGTAKWGEYRFVPKQTAVTLKNSSNAPAEMVVLELAD